MEWASLLNVPLSIAGLIGIIAALQKAGVNVGGMVRGFLEVRDAGTAKESDADMRNVLQTMVYQMSELSNHFNHETTESQIRIEKALEKLLTTSDDTNRALQEILKYGIKCRKE